MKIHNYLHSTSTYQIICVVSSEALLLPLKTINCSGKLIGNNGTFIKKLKEDCRVNIILKETREKLKIKRPRSRKDQK